MKRLAALLAGIMMMAAGSAYALPTLNLTSGTDTVVVTDGGAGDANTITGVVTYVGPVGANWFVNVTTGESTPVLTGIPHLDLNSINNSLRAGTLTITLSDILSSYINGATIDVGGTTSSGTVNFSTNIGGGAAESSLTLAGSAYSGSDVVSYLGESSAIDLIATIVHTQGGSTSFDYSVAPVPEPGTMLLLGAGFLGLAIYGKRRKNA